MRLERNQEKKLLATNWRIVPAIQMDAIQEDSRKVNKQWGTMSFRVIKQLKPIIQKAEAQGEDKIAIGLLLTGEGIDSSLAIRELPPNYRQLFRESE